MLDAPLKKMGRSHSTNLANANIIFFYEKPLDNSHSRNMYLSVHYYSPFTEMDFTTYPPIETKFNSCTQYYHYYKFKILGATKESAEILSISSPEDAYDKSKILEKKYFDSSKWKIWEEQKVDVMRNAIRLKFTQNPVLMQKLLMTADKLLIHDHPYDAFWYFSYDMRFIRGGTLPNSKNVLGDLLMEFRDAELKKSKIVPLESGEVYENGYIPNKPCPVFFGSCIYKI